MDKIRILMVLGNTRRGGTQSFILNVLHHIDLSIFQIDIAINYDDTENNGVGEEFKACGCQIFFWPYFKIFNYIQFVRFWNDFFQTHSYNIVHAHSTNSASLYLKIAKKYGCVTISHSHNEGYRGYWYQRFFKKMFAKGTAKSSDYWFACSEKAAFRLYGSRYKGYERYYTIPNAIDVDKYRYDEVIAKRIRKEIGIKDDQMLCGHVGTFSLQKNHIFLLSVFKEVLKINPQAKLVCCGGGYHIDQIKTRAKNLGIYDRIIFAGVVENVNEYLMAMDVFIFPSFFEGFPMSVIEAETTGLPIVMSDSITRQVVLTDIVNCKSLYSSVEDWAREVCNARVMNREKYNDYISETNYNIKNSIEQISSLYRIMVGERSKRD